MKKTIIFLFMGIFLSLATLSNAQQFWIENWNNGGSLPQGTLSYTSSVNGAWSIQQTGANGADSNAWYFSTQEEGMGRGVCGTSGSPATAHMGNTANAPLLGAAGADNGAIIDDGAGTTTNLRLQSPVINCTGKSTITLSFNYIQGKSGGNDYITVDYYDGTSWTTLSTPAELDSCPSTTQGLWTYYSKALPASANNNANVKIGFNWTNNTNSTDDNAFIASSTEVVSFAVDSVVLSTPPPALAPVAGFKVSDTIPCHGDSVHFTDTSTNTPTSWKWYFQNGAPATSTLQNPWVHYNTGGQHDSVKLVVKNASGSDSLTKKKYIHVKFCGLGIEGISNDNTISIYPNPAKNTINLAFANSISGNAKVDITDITGRIVSTQILNASTSKTMSIDVSAMSTGMYIVKVTKGSNIYFEKFIKQ